MVKKLLMLLTITILFAGCETIDIDPDYPTTYLWIPSPTLEQLRTEFALNNVYLNSTLSDFGFCSRWDYDVSPKLAPVLDTLTENEAIELVRAFVSFNPSATGVKSINDFIIEKIWRGPVYNDGSIPWQVRSSNQMADTIEVLDTKIYFSIKNRELVSVANNRFPDIYIPDNFVFNQEQAKSKLVGKKVSHNTWGGKVDMTISAADLNSSVTKLVIMPIKTDETIELRVAWQIWIESVAHIIYLDVMNGEILREEPTIRY
jgi:hypothetical protein